MILRMLNVAASIVLKLFINSPDYSNGILTGIGFLIL